MKIEITRVRPRDINQLVQHSVQIEEVRQKQKYSHHSYKNTNIKFLKELYCSFCKTTTYNTNDYYAETQKKNNTSSIKGNTKSSFDFACMVVEPKNKIMTNTIIAKILDFNVEFLLDTGSTYSFLGENVLTKLKNNLTLKEVNKIFKLANNSNITLNAEAEVRL